MKMFSLATGALLLLLSSCATTTPAGADPHWTRVGTHVEFQNVSADDHGRDFWAWDNQLTGHTYHSVTVRATKTRGGLNNGYGILWGYQNDGNYARLLITANGQIAAHEYHDGRETILVDWPGLAHLRVGLGSTNEIHLEQAESGIRLVVNGADSGTIESGYRLEGKLGCFTAVDFNETQPNGVVVEFDYDPLGDPL